MLQFPHLSVSGAVLVRDGISSDTVVVVAIVLVVPAEELNLRNRGDFIAAVSEETDGRALHGKGDSVNGDVEGVVIADHDGEEGDVLKLGTVAFVAVELFRRRKGNAFELLKDIEGNR